VSLTLRPPWSVAVTRTERVVTSVAVGVPEKLRALGLKVNQVGSGAPAGVPSSRRALYERLSPVSMSRKEVLGTM